MVNLPPTQPELILRIRDPRDDEAWRRFVELYAPVVFRFAARNGLQEADAADLTQDVLRAVAGGVRRLEYDPGRGAFRSWLYTVARNRLRDIRATRSRGCPGSGDSAVHAALADAPAPADDEETWDHEYERQVFACAAESVRGEFAAPTWQAFWRVAVEGCPAADVARDLGMTVGAVYIAKSRVLKRLRAAVRELVAATA